MDIQVKIFKDGNKDPISESKQSNMRMTLNTFIEYPVSMNGKRLEPGEYEAEITVKSQENVWSWKKKFSVNAETAKKLNNSDIGLKNESSIDWKIIVLSLLVLMLIIIIVIVSRKKRIEQKNDI